MTHHDRKILRLHLFVLPPTVMYPRVLEVSTHLQFVPQDQSQLSNPDVDGNLQMQHVFP